MNPGQAVEALRQIASKIETSKNPDKSLVAKDLKKIILRITSTIDNFTGQLSIGESGYVKGTIKVDNKLVTIEDSWTSGSRGGDPVIDGKRIERDDPLYDELDEYFVNLCFSELSGVEEGTFEFKDEKLVS